MYSYAHIHKGDLIEVNIDRWRGQLMTVIDTYADFIHAYDERSEQQKRFYYRAVSNVITKEENPEYFL